MNKTEPHNTVDNRKTVMFLTLIAVAMLGLGMAAKPLYDTFCRVTGYGGTTRVADALSTTTLERPIKVRFDSNVAAGLNWSFRPLQTSVNVKLGENTLAFYMAENNSDVAVVGTASYNVAPIKAAPFFSKIECFCFTEQRLEPGESVKMPVLFFVDPLMAEEIRLEEVKTITLSYTFHPVDKPGDDAFTAKDRQAAIDTLTTLDLSQ